MTKLEQEAWDFASTVNLARDVGSDVVMMIRHAAALGYLAGAKAAIERYHKTAQQTLKRQVMAALDKESQLELDAFKLRQELHAELDTKPAQGIMAGYNGLSG